MTNHTTCPQCGYNLPHHDSACPDRPREVALCPAHAGARARGRGSDDQRLTCSVCRDNGQHVGWYRDEHNAEQHPTFAVGQTVQLVRSHGKADADDAIGTIVSVDAGVSVQWELNGFQLGRWWYSTTDAARRLVEVTERRPAPTRTLADATTEAVENDDEWAGDSEWT